MRGIYLKLLKKFATGTTVAVTHFALDVYPRNTAADALYVSGVSGLTVKEIRYHDTASTNIQANSGTFVEIGTAPAAAALANTILEMRVTCTFGEPIVIRKAASAVAALAQEVANTVPLCVLNRGESADFPVSLVATDRIWVMSKTTTAVSAGLLILNLKG